MRRYIQLTTDEQAQAAAIALNELGASPDLLSDATLRPRIDQAAQARARQAYYLDPGDRVVTLPAATVPVPVPTTPTT